jgi:oxygen-dependent protoporphyrinogen oxidase
MTAGTPPHVVIVGGGIAGLAAAFFLKDEPVTVTLLEGSHRLGGKLSASEVAGVPMDEGAEALLARRPEGIDLITATGLGEALVPAGVTSSAIFTRGAMRPLPRRQFMGVPADIDELAAAGVVSAEGVARARREPDLPAGPGDVSVTGYIGARLGAEVVDRLVDPLLGGVYAGRSEDLSFTATLAPLAAATARHRTLTEAAASLIPASPPPALPASPPPALPVRPPPPLPVRPPPAPVPTDNSKRPPTAPVFVTLTTGLGALPEVLAKASNADVRTGVMVRDLARSEEGWRLTVGSAADPEYLRADAVILAVPAAPASRLLSRTVPAASRALSEIPYASMAIITLAYPADAVRQQQRPGQARSGYLVPAVDGRAVKAVTFSTVKWPHLAAHAPVHVVRCSIGRSGEVSLLQRDDEDLAALAAAELADATGVTAAPVARRVTRWGGGLPQYNVGHLDRVARVREAVAGQPGLAVAGAAYDGVGIPACIATARSATMSVMRHVRAAATDRSE